ncbi:hypothetical protein [Herbaspirillum sp.]|uniref:hypothetical protein n=1 Tax=Herbaspirillum sp. TaxID=1890675 RepID=UPI001B17A4D3|nr:hypothetical protein [Herbaspirillum sp.]MBO9538073.1 hypothetical protein [Herbaspirillum sp.]
MKALLFGLAMLVFHMAANAGCVWQDKHGNPCKQGTNGCLYLKCTDKRTGTGVRG